MKEGIDLVNGKVSSILIKLALPMIGANFAQTAFGLIDMIWVGSLGSKPVSAVGTASFYLNLAAAIATLITIGVGVKYAQYLGSKDENNANKYLSASIILSIIIASIYFSIIFILADRLIAFYNIKDTVVVDMAISYLRISLIGTPFLFLSLTLTSLLTSKGKTRSVFIGNTTGLVINIILDPIMIFGFGSIIPKMGIAGAAWATNISRIITFLILLYAMKEELLKNFKLGLNIKETLTIVKLGFPVTMQRVVFTFISMYMAKIIATFGTDAIAAQKVGLQIESITYVTIGGLQGAIVAFVGQNFGAKNFKRIKEGYNKSLLIAVAFSLITTTLFILLPRPLFKIFIDEPNVIDIGVGYMRAIGISQMFMCIEYITVGVFNGMGKTYVPPIISIIFTGLRIPMAMILIKFLGTDGVWWSISISSILKGLILFTLMKLLMRKDDFAEGTV